MPRKKPDDDELKRKALELRGKGLSYREIGKQLEEAATRHGSLFHHMRAISPRSRRSQNWTKR